MIPAADDTRFGDVTAWVASLAGWRRGGLAFAAGALSVLAFAPVFAFPILFLTFPVLVWLIDSSACRRSAARDGWWFAFGYFFFNLFWLGEAFLVEAEKFAVLLPFAVTLLPAALAVFWALAIAAAKAFWRAGYARLVILAVALSIAEWLRGHLFTGLPWNVPGYALTYPIELMQSAALAGVYALSILAILIFSAPLVLWFEKSWSSPARRLTVALASAAVPLALLWAYGTAALKTEIADVPGVKLRLVQPSVPQREKWMAEHQARIFREHLTMSAVAPDGIKDDLSNITHVVWPEAAMPFLPLEHPDALQAIADLLPDGRILLTGALRRELTDSAGQPLPHGMRKAFNGLMAFDGEGRLIANYDKIHLVPFGEYLPLAPALGALGLSQLANKYGAFTPGATPRPVLSVPGLPALVGLVCYEALFPGEILQSDERPGVLVNVTNDGWFGNTTGPYQHFHQVRVRAVEEGLPIIRVANNGISAVIDPLGRVRAELGLNVRGIADARLPVALKPTLYSRMGDMLLGALCIVAIVLTLVMSKFRWRRS